MKSLTTKIVAAVIISGIIAASLTSCGGLLREETNSPVNTEAPVTQTVGVESESETEKELEIITKPDKTVDLTGSTGVTADVLRETVKTYPNLERLTAADVTVSMKDYVEICRLNEKADVITRVSFDGAEIDLSLDEIDISGTVITDKALFEQFVSLIPAGKKLVMCDCGFTNEEMGALREKHTDTEFVWRLYLSKWNLRTDDEAFSVMIYASDTYEPLTTEDIKVLTYCTNLYALDLGHQDITDLTPLGEITTLRVLILADNEITDVTPLANLKNLQYLELFVNRIWDISPLAACTELVDLNFGWNSVSDLSGIYSLPKLERLWLPTNRVPVAKRAEISEKFPNAQIVFEDKDSVSSGWRTHPRFASMRGMFTNNKYDENFAK